MSQRLPDAEVDVLVTNEKRLPSRVKRAGFTVGVWSMDRFATWLRTPA